MSDKPEVDKELLKVVLEDLDYLIDEWNQDIDDGSLRRASPTLRSLLVEGNLLKASQQVSFHNFRVMAPKSFYDIYSEEELANMKFWQAGGARYRGEQKMEVSIRYQGLMRMDVLNEIKQKKDLITKNYPVKLSAFLKQPSIVVERTPINRDEIIKYVSNKLGGAHYDNSRPDKKLLDKKYKLLDSVRDNNMASDYKNAIYFELLSIGQRLVNTKDVAKLRKLIKKKF